jgi:ornithine cyclodeaminase/alanine dehydrogenase-like protein (mu-crystallin family)
MKTINFEEILRLNISPRKCVLWTKDALINKYQYKLPAKISIKLPNNIFHNTMPSYLTPINYFGVKIVSRYPDREPSIQSEILLYDTENGNLLAVMDGSWITAMRTGAVAALSVQLLRSPATKQYGFIGLGNTARATLLCLADTLEKEELNIKLLAYKNQEIDFINRFKDFKQFHFSICHTTEELVSTSDVIVSSLTVADNLIAPDHCYNPGVLVIPIHTKGFQNCDLFFDKVFVDDIDHVKDFKYFSKFKAVDELSNVFLGNNPGRTTKDERILAYNIGISIIDIYFSHKIYELKKYQLGESVSLCTNKNKFWI